MAKRTPKNPDNQFAELVIGKITEQSKLLLGRNWTQIHTILKKNNGEIKFAIGTTITDREATPGEQADRDNRIRVTLSFSEKHSDTIESELPDPDQLTFPEPPE